jgi:phage N-6-adenine-methyltransferase
MKPKSTGNKPIIWSTPQPIFDVLNKEFEFQVDLCADPDNAKCKNWLDRQVSLDTDWSGEGTAWLNPPYGKDITDWVRKAARTNRRIVGFLPGRTNAPWWHDHVMQAIELRFVRRKVSFANGEGCKGVPPWGAVVAIWEPFNTGLTPVAVSWDWRKK